MGVTPNSDTQQNIAIHAANITHHGSIAQTSKNRLRSELFLPAFFAGSGLWFTYWWWQYGFNL